MKIQTTLIVAALAQCSAFAPTVLLPTRHGTSAVITLLAAAPAASKEEDLEKTREVIRQFMGSTSEEETKEAQTQKEEKVAKEE
jgi:hypothetical protein